MTVLVLAMIYRRLLDLRLRGHRQAALDWFERGECRAWCCSCGLDFAKVMERVETEMSKPIYRNRWAKF